MKRAFPVLLFPAFCIMLLAFAPALPAWAADTGSESAENAEEKAKPLTRDELIRIERLWTRCWREYAANYIEYNGKYIYVPGYSRSLPSSAGITTRDYRKKSQWVQDYTDENGDKKKRTLTKPEQDARAAVEMMPKVEVGQYGYIHSGNIDKIIDKSTLILEDIWLIDGDKVSEEKTAYREKARERFKEDVADAIDNLKKRRRRSIKRGMWSRLEAEYEAIDWAFKGRLDAASRQDAREYSRNNWTVIGYRTDKLAEDKRWPVGRAAEKGLQLVIVEVSDGKVTAMPAAKIGKGLSEAAFLLLLTKRGISKQKFVDFVYEAKRVDRDGYQKLAFAYIQGEKPDLDKLAEKKDEVKDGKGADEKNDTVELAD